MKHASRLLKSQATTKKQKKISPITKSMPLTGTMCNIVGSWLIWAVSFLNWLGGSPEKLIPQVSLALSLKGSSRSVTSYAKHMKRRPRISAILITKLTGST